MAPGRHLGRTAVSVAVLDCSVLAGAGLLSYWLVTNLLARLHSVSMADDQLGGLWAVIATVFVCRFSYHQSTAAALSRISATFVSFVFCLAYLTFLPFRPWALAVLLGASALAVTLIGRPGDAITAGITTAVVMVSAALSPQDAWQQPILRLADTVVGVAVGVAAAWLGRRAPSPDASGDGASSSDSGSAATAWSASSRAGRWSGPRRSRRSAS
jgi:Fusaric acid resistance protein-like